MLQVIVEDLGPWLTFPVANGLTTRSLRCNMGSWVSQDLKSVSLCDG